MPIWGPDPTPIDTSVLRVGERQARKRNGGRGNDRVKLANVSE
jgi:hypothetical protein